MRGLGDSPRGGLLGLLLMAAAFAAGTVIASLAGATDLGTAMTFGLLAYTGVLAAILLIRR